MSRAHADNALLASTHEALGLLAKICLVFATGVATGGAWYLLVGLRAGGL